MAYKVEYHKDVVVISFYDHVDGLDVAQLHRDTLFIEGLRQFNKILYDYSPARSLCMALDDVRSFARLAHIESQFTPHMHLVIVPQNTDYLDRAHRYQDMVSELGWQVDVAANKQDALALFDDLSLNTASA